MAAASAHSLDSATLAAPSTCRGRAHGRVKAEESGDKSSKRREKTFFVNEKLNFAHSAAQNILRDKLIQTLKRTVTIDDAIRDG